MKKSIFLIFAAILCSVSAWAYNYGGTNVYYYFANTASWSGVHLYIWNGGWNQDFTLTKIANTNVYYHKWSSAYNNNEGILFRGAADWSHGQTSDIKANYTSHTSWVQNNTTGKTDLSNINRQAKVVAMLSTGGDYTATANANCTATVSGYTVEKGKSTATSKSASTSGSANNASINAAYGSTITYTATAGTGYTFEGFSTSNSKTLPATKYDSGKTATASKYGSTNNTTYYAYFKANQYTVKFDANGGTGSMSDQSHAYGVSTALTANAFERTGYTFAGWNTKADGTGTSYTDQQSISNLSSTDGATITLYAQWEEIPANSHNITYTAQAAGWTYGEKPASAEEGATVTFEVNPTTGYTVTVTSSDVSLSNSGNTYTFTMPTTDVAIDVTATENTHDVTISYKCGDQTIQANGTATAVGEITAKEITAPEITGYKFTSWTLGDGITNKSANTTTNPINITTKASGTYTLTANYEKVVTIYFVNSSKWTAVNCHHWVSKDNTAGTTWPGDKLTKTGETVNEFDVYKATFTNAHTMCIFNNNGAGQQTGDLEVQDGKYYYPLKDQWYASLNDIPAIDPLATNVFLVGAMNGWSTDTDEFRKATKEATTASIILNLSANTDYEFKVIRDGAWTSYKGTITKDASGLQFSSSTSDNAKITTSVAGDYTFTWTISSSKLAVTYPTICAITATANDAAMGTIVGAGNYGKGSTATLTATPNDGYLFVNWTKDGVEVATTQEYSFKVTEAVELVANFEAAAEEVHNVTVSYVCGGNKIAEDQTVAAVGVTTPKTAEAPAIFGYTFTSWTLGEDVTSTDELTSNTIDINIVAGGSDFTLTANYTEIPKVTIYVVNNTKWDKVYAYGWGGSVGENPAWPGQDITANKEAEQIVGFDVYSYSVVPGSYVNIKFTNGSGAESANFKWTDGKYYYMDAANDYVGGTKEEVTKVLTPTYTVAGNNRIVFGEEWAPAKADNDMVDQGDGTYKWTKSQIALKKNTEIRFKVVKNHDWGKGSWPGEDWVINTINKDGYYTITITFKESDQSITATATWTGEAPIKDFSNQPTTLYFHPSFHWTSDNAQFAAYFYNEGFGADAEPTWVNMTDDNSDGIYELANAKKHEYIIICRMNPNRTETRWNKSEDDADDAAKAKKPVWNQISTGLSIPNTAGDLNTCLAFWTNCQGDVPTSECTWVAPTPLTDKNWDAFVAAYNGKTINAVVERSFNHSQYHTLCLPFDIPTNWLGEGTEAYQLTSIVANNTGDKLSLNATKWETIVAGKPYIIVPVKGSEYEHVIINNVTVKNASAGTNVASGDGYKATLKAVTATGGQTNGSTEYYVGAKDGKLYNAQTNKLGLRALIELTTTSGQPLPPKVRAQVTAGENVETGIEDLFTTDAPVKVIENGQLIIIRDGVKYNVQGQKL